MFRRSAGSLVCALLALLTAATAAGAARIQAAARGGTGFANRLIYAVGNNAAQDAADFNDYQVGTNGAYQALPGWDYVSGWGTPILTPLMKDIDHGRTAPIQRTHLATQQQ